MEKELKRAADLCSDKKFEDAIAIYTNLLSEKSNAKIYYFRAKAYFFQKKYEEALSDMNLAVDTEPFNVEIISERALCHHMIGNHDLAMRDFDKAVALEPQNAYRYASRAFIKDRTGDLKGAIQDYKKSLDLDPENAITHNNLGIVYQKLGDKKQAQLLFDKADEIDPEKFGQKKITNIDANEEKEHFPENKEVAKSEEMNFSHFGKVIGSLLSDKNERQNFVKFIKNKFGKSV